MDMTWKRAVRVTGIASLGMACSLPFSDPPCPDPASTRSGDACSTEGQVCMIPGQEEACGQNGFRCEDGEWDSIDTFCNPPPPVGGGADTGAVQDRRKHCDAPAPGLEPLPLRFEAEHIRKEFSRDSGTRRLHAVFDGSIVTITGPTAPCVRSRCESDTVRFALSRTDQIVLMRLIDGQDFWRDVDSGRKGSSSTGAYAELTASIEIKDDTRSGRSRVGYIRPIGRGTSAPKTVPADALAMEQRIEALLTHLQSAARRCHPDFKPGR